MTEALLAVVALVTVASTIYAARSDKGKGLVDSAVLLHNEWKEEAEHWKHKALCYRTCLEENGIDPVTECDD